MTTETDTQDPYADTVCSHCGGPVKRRRPSLSGRHFCSKRDCKKAKERFHYRRRAEGAAHDAAVFAKKKAEQRDGEIIGFVTAALQEPRVTCEDCGRTDTVPRYPHPRPDRSGGCIPPDALPLPIFTEDDDIARRLLRAAYAS